MAITLPTQPIKATRISPKIIVLYGLPKVGKTKAVSELENNLNLDMEGGAEMYDSLRVPISRSEQLDEVYTSIMSEAVAYKTANPDKPAKYPYTYITLDTADMLEELCEISATKKYKDSKLGGKFEGDSVLELPNGGGYYYLRNEVIGKIKMLSKVCRHLIIIAHVKDKVVTTKKGDEVNIKDLSLVGKLSGMVCAEADAIGYMYRNSSEGGALWVSFETYDGAIMGARQPYLAGKKMPFNWADIFID